MINNKKTFLKGALNGSFFFIIFLRLILGADEVKIEINNVGQGNGVFIRGGGSLFIIDCGSSSCHPESQITTCLQKNYQDGIAYGEEAEIKQINIKASRHKMKQHQFLDAHKTFESIDNKKLGSKLRNKLLEIKTEDKEIVGTADQGPPLHIKTILISHPDIDHYNLLHLVVNGSKDTIENIILAGLPHYYLTKHKQHNEFTRWVQQFQKDGTKLFFPAVSDKSLPFNDALKLAKRRIYQLPWHTLSKKQIESGKLNREPEAIKSALTISEHSRLHFLSVNPSHAQGENGVVRLSLPTDDNSDSIVVRVDHGVSSALITGDATEVTLRRIMDNYGDDLDFLKSIFFLMCHHGSAHEGANKKAFLKLVCAQYYVFSNGLKHRHPHRKTFNTVMNLLEKAEVVDSKSHLFMVPAKKGATSSGSKKRGESIYELREVPAHMYSTLCNGDVEFILSSIPQINSEFKVPLDFLEAESSQENSYISEEEEYYSSDSEGSNSDVSEDEEEPSEESSEGDEGSKARGKRSAERSPSPEASSSTTSSSTSASNFTLGTGKKR